MPLISPILWQGTPFGHIEAAGDFYGMHDLWHSILARKAGPPLAQYRLDDLPELGDVHQRLHVQLARAFLIDEPSDFSLYDLRQRQGWTLFMQLHSVEHERLRLAAGV